MTILFCGGEIDDFTQFFDSGSTSAVVHTTTTTFFRSTYARAAVQTITASNLVTGGIRASFTASSQFSVSFRSYTTSVAASGTFFRLRSGGSDRLLLQQNGGASPVTVSLRSSDGTTPTTLATSASSVMASNTLHRWDVIVDYGTSGRVRVYLDAALIIDYSGDVTQSGSTTLDSLQLQSARSDNGSQYYSEVIVCTQDSRSLSLKTLVPDGAGSSTWDSGAYSDVDEVTAAESDTVLSATANQEFIVNCTGMPSGVGTVSVAAVKVVGSAARGATGPSKLALGVKSGGSTSYATGVTLDYNYPYVTAATAAYFQTNPITSAAFTTSEIDNLQLAFKSET